MGQVHDCLETIRKDVTKRATSQITAFRSANKKYSQARKRRDGVQAAVPPAIAATLAASDADLLRRGLRKVPIILLGDTNCDPTDQSGVHALLLHGEATVHGKVNGTAQSGGDQSMSKSAKPKTNVFGAMVDAYEEAYTSIGSGAPPTLICEELYGVLTQSGEDDGTGDIYKLSPLALGTLQHIFRKFATVNAPAGASANGADGMGNEVNSTTAILQASELDVMMSAEDVTMWLTAINGRADRGSELRAAVQHMQSPSGTASTLLGASTPSPEAGNGGGGADDDEGEDMSPVELPPAGFLTWEGFVAIYAEMVYQGKVWAVSYDFAVCGFPLPASERVFTARYDRAYVGGVEALRLMAVRDLAVGSVDDGCRGVGGCLPNADHPSDHLPIAVVVGFHNEML